MDGVRIRITGRVQGVGFRGFVARRAAELALTGTVRNLDDGSVEAEAEGPRDALERFVEALRAGPPHARVEHAAVEWRPGGARRTGFHITG